MENFTVNNYYFTVNKSQEYQGQLLTVIKNIYR